MVSQDIGLRYTGITRRAIAGPQRAGLIAVAVGVLYFAAARLSLELQSHGVAVFWPAAGIAAGTLIALGPRARWPVAAGVVIANIAANLLGDRNLWAASVVSLADAGEAMIAAAVIEYRFGERFALNRFSHVLGLLVATVVATALSGLVGTLGYVLFYPSAASMASIWREWFVSDALGIVTVAPMLIGFAGVLRRPPARAGLIEGTVGLALVAGVSCLVIGDAQGPWTMAVPLALSFPLLLWIGARCPPVFAAAASFIASSTIDLTTTFGIGVFGNPVLPLDERIQAARGGVVAVALCALVLAALFAERRRHERALGESEERLRVAIEAGRMAVWEHDDRTSVQIWSDEVYRIFGYRVGEVAPSRSSWLARVHPDDRATAEAAVIEAKLDFKDSINEFRIVRPDGAVRWLRASGRYLRAGRDRFRTIGLIEDVTEAREQIETQRVMVAELQHRTRNLMAVVHSIALQTLSTTGSPTEFAQKFDRRLQALSRVQSLLSCPDKEAITLGALVRMELEAIGSEGFANRISVGGPRVPLRKSAVEMLALAIHELATNTLKYGALASANGRLSVTWTIVGTGATRKVGLEWIERGIVAAPANRAPRGYGRELIEEALPYSLSAQTAFELTSDALRCTIRLPLTASGAEEAVR